LLLVPRRSLTFRPSSLREQLPSLEAFHFFHTDDTTAIEPSPHPSSPLSLLLVRFILTEDIHSSLLPSSPSLSAQAHRIATISFDHQRKIMAAPSPEKWQCHECKTGPQLCATAICCAQCGHNMCDECKKDGEIPSPLGAGVLRSPPTRAPTTYSHAMPRNVPNMAPRGNIRDRDRGRYYQPALRLSSRPPPLTGWWICHVCSFKNNPDLCGGRCTHCQHLKCPICRPWRR
jgi:hypothetical protein